MKKIVKSKQFIGINVKNIACNIIELLCICKKSQKS